ncbi:MAG: hypothetical protein H0X37_23310 [Herpetosiphonaceae bacterium]|nr:hypothetical protein [Herpetosiphonaceae bacterium]
MILLNFTHPLTDAQRAQIEGFASTSIEREITVPVQIDNSAPLPAQVAAIVDGCGLAPDEWQTLDLVVNPPGLASAATVLMAEIHGRRGSFPAIIRIQPAASALTTTYEVAEVINVQLVRDTARTRRWTS